MTAESLFSIANSLAIVAWIGLVLFPRRRWAVDIVPAAATLLFAALYVLLIGTQWLQSDGGFGSLSDVAALFANRWLLLAGWLHYLAFDLLVGRWEARDAERRAISRWLVAPVLLATFMFGPAGWLVYMGLRWSLQGRALPAAA
jgi:hypothetical protein